LYHFIFIRGVLVFFNLEYICAVYGVPYYRSIEGLVDEVDLTVVCQTLIEGMVTLRLKRII
jgi:hypothetical protein